MKHILNDLTEQEKNAIREQHTGGMKVITEKFSKLINSKLGDSKPLVVEQIQDRIQTSPSPMTKPKVIKDKITSPSPMTSPSMKSVIDKPFASAMPAIKACIAKGSYPKISEFMKREETKQLNNIVVDLLMSLGIKKDPAVAEELRRLVECLNQSAMKM